MTVLLSYKLQSQFDISNSVLPGQVLSRRDWTLYVKLFYLHNVGGGDNNHIYFCNHSLCITYIIVSSAFYSWNVLYNDDSKYLFVQTEMLVL